MSNDLGRSFTEDEIIQRLDGMDVVIAAEEPYRERVFKAAPRLGMVARDGVGFDSVDLEAATRYGVVATNAPVLHETVADMTFGLILAVVRKIIICDRGVRQGRWLERDLFLASDVNGKTLGIFGFGRIGRAVAMRAAGFNMKIIAYDPYADPNMAKEAGVCLVDKEELLRTADIITIHMPLTPQTQDMMDAKAFEKMKDGACLINIARGEIVDEQALIAALKSGRLSGAGLDVIRNEPPKPDNPLFQFENVVFTPHVGSDTFDTFRKVCECVVDDVLLFLEGKKPSHVLNPDVFQHERFDKERIK